MGEKKGGEKKNQDSLNLINLFQSVNFVMSLKIVLGEKAFTYDLYLQRKVFKNKFRLALSRNYKSLFCLSSPL